MKIHHYTSIETLEAILKNKTIRFNRMDFVDDPNEIELDINGMAFAKYIFISCWTLEENESIPQWSMYAGQSRGVRITLDSEHILNDFFSQMTIKLDNNFENNLKSRCIVQGDAQHVYPCTFISQSEGIAYVPIYFYHGSLIPRTAGLSIMPIPNGQPKLKTVEYCESLDNPYGNSIRIQNNGNGEYNTLFTSNIGFKKHKDWAFQQEARFVLMTMHTYPQKKGDFIIDYPNINFSKYGFPPQTIDKQELN